MYSDEEFPNKEEEGEVEEELENEDPYLTSIQKTIRIIYNLTKNVYERLMHIQDNFQKIVTLSSQWSKTPMYVRDKTTKLMAFDDHMVEMKTTRCNELQSASVEIQRLLREDVLLFHNVPLVDPNWGKFILLFN